MFSFTPRPLYLQAKGAVPIEDSGWAPESVWTSWRKENSLAPAGTWFCNYRPILRFPNIHTSHSKQQPAIIHKAGPYSKHKPYINSIWNSSRFHHAKQFFLTEKSLQFSFPIPWFKGNQCHKAWPHQDLTPLVSHNLKRFPEAFNLVLYW